MKTITLEEWEELQKKFPITISRFKKWIDEYKVKVKWDNIFNTGSPHYAKMGWHSLKLHDLPIAMQFGIFTEYLTELPIPRFQDEPKRSMDDILEFFNLELPGIEKDLEDS